MRREPKWYEVPCTHCGVTICRISGGEVLKPDQVMDIECPACGKSTLLRGDREAEWDADA